MNKPPSSERELRIELPTCASTYVLDANVFARNPFRWRKYNRRMRLGRRFLTTSWVRAETQRLGFTVAPFIEIVPVSLDREHAALRSPPGVRGLSAADVSLVQLVDSLWIRGLPCRLVTEDNDLRSIVKDAWTIEEFVVSLAGPAALINLYHPFPPGNGPAPVMEDANALRSDQAVDGGCPA